MLVLVLNTLVMGIIVNSITIYNLRFVYQKKNLRFAAVYLFNHRFRYSHVYHLALKVCGVFEQ